MKEAGYHTMMAGKWHLGGSTMKYSKGMQREWQNLHVGWELTEEELEADFLGLPAQRGFTDFFGTYEGQDNFFLVPGQKHPVMEGNQEAELDYGRTYAMHCYSKDPRGRYTSNHGKTGKAFYDTDGTTDRAIEMLRSASGDDKPPFLMYVSYRAPHKPLQAPEALVQKYLAKYEDIEAVAEARVQNLKRRKLYPEDGSAGGFWPPTDPDDFRRQMAVHSAMMEKVDDNVGRLVAALEETGELEHTLIFYFSDNGSAAHLHGIMNAPYRGAKALMWEGGTRTHFIAVWPGHIKPGSISHEQAWVGDLLPSCLDAAGIAYPETFRGTKTSPLDGRSMLQVLEGEAREAADALFFNDKGQQAVIHEGRWKLLIEPGWFRETRAAPGIAYELYDLKKDPAETRNLAKERPELVQLLAKRCEAWKKNCGIVDYAERIKIRPKDPF